MPAFLSPEHQAEPQIYDKYRDIRFKPEKALWRDAGLPFQIQMFHMGMVYQHPVAIHVVDNGQVETIPFSTEYFDYGKNDFKDKIPSDLGFAGLRIHAPLNTQDYYDEVAVFLGASYFRAVGQFQHYGLSARGLAVDTAESTGEEFPYFIAYWLEKPKPGDKEMVFYALLDSPSISGAYRFVVVPGKETTVQVEMRLFPRKAITKLGIAPLTSMYFFGENTTHKAVDFRPEVHDSDGLVIKTEHGEWIWRPIQNDRHLLINVFSLNNPRGFGLSQRDRNFDHYQDLEARYDNRPSAWVVPLGDWGQGRVELVQIPTANEYNDNIVAFWVPQASFQAGDELGYSYRISFQPSNPERQESGYVSATYTVPGKGSDVRKIVLDFVGKKLEELPGDAKLEAIIDVSGNGSLLEHQIQKNAVTQGWRLVFQIRHTNDQPMELRVSLKRDDDYLTETWSYTIAP
jgi:glucans biosynthesis protein